MLFKDDAVLRASTLLTFGIVMVMGSFQGLVLPVHFTETGHPELLGYVLSAMAAGMLAGSLGYAALAPRARKRTWYLISLAGMAASVALMGMLPAFPALIAGAVVLGMAADRRLTAGIASPTDRIPNAHRGSALGTQNALMLVAAPVAVFATSIVVKSAGTSIAALVLVGAWMLVTVAALCAKSMRNLDEAVRSPSGAGEAARETSGAAAQSPAE